MRKGFHYFLVVCIMLLWLFPAAAQQQKSNKSTPASKKGLVPVYKSSLGNVLSNTMPASMMKKLLDSSLVARDKNGETYPVIAFDFGYQQNETIVNDTTGRPKTTHDYHYWHFKSNRLDSVWRVHVQSELKPGDQLYFDHIIAEDEQGNKYLSSPLHFIIK